MARKNHLSASRRELLLGGLGGAGLLSFGGIAGSASLARAANSPTNTDHHFIFCYYSGGWDPLLGIDPKKPDNFPDELRNETLIHLGYDNLRLVGTGITDPYPSRHNGVLLGPYIGDLADWTDRVAFIRGMSMDTLTHEVGRRRFLTGMPPSGLLARGSSTATWLASLLGADHPVPNLSARVESYNVDQPAWASALKVDNVDDLLRALRPGDIDIAPEERDRVQALLEEFRDCHVVSDRPEVSAALSAQSSARTLVGEGLDALFDFGSSDPAMVSLRERFALSPTDLGSPQAQGAMAVTALTAGISRCVSIEVANGLDTHFDNWETDQGPNQMEGHNVVATIMAELDSIPYQGTGDTWLDHTTIVGFSEFSRTALINANSGRDHALTGACFVAGGGIRAGAYGASSDVGLLPQAVDLTTGELDKNGDVVKPEHILRALFEMTGVTDDVADLRVSPYRAILA